MDRNKTLLTDGQRNVAARALAAERLALRTLDLLLSLRRGHQALTAELDRAVRAELRRALQAAASPGTPAEEAELARLVSAAEKHVATLIDEAVKVRRK